MLARLFYYLNAVLSLTILAFVVLAYTNDSTEELENHSLDLSLIPDKVIEPSLSLEIADNGPFSLAAPLYELGLPDVRDLLHYYGTNERPDLDPTKKVVYIGLQKGEQTICAEEGKRLYLLYQKESNQAYQAHSSAYPTAIWGQTDARSQGTYTFSPNNVPSSLWITPSLDRQNNRLFITVHLLDDQNRQIVHPKELLTFALEKETLANHKQSPFMLGSHRVDSTLLVRQKARFVGHDLFLEDHGGNEYAHCIDKVRIDFLTAENPYSLFVGEGDALFWNGQRWQAEEKKDAPLMVLKSISEKMASFQVWNENGMQKVAIHLIRAKDHFGLPDLAQEFRFKAAKTWARFSVECGKQKLTLRPNDWLVLTQEGWQLIETVEQIEEFVDQKIVGPLFVVGKLKQEKGRQHLLGTLYNTLRTASFPVELEQNKQGTFPAFTEGDLYE